MCQILRVFGCNFPLGIVLILVVCFINVLNVFNKSFCQTSLSSTAVVAFYFWSELTKNEKKKLYQFSL